MSEDKKKQDKAEKQEEKFQQRMPGPKGEVGKGTPASKLKRLWHETHFKREDANDRFNPRKTFWKPSHSTPSLKEFVRSLLGDEKQGALAKRWLDSKDGKFNEKRSDKNTARIALEKQASKSARRKKSGGKAAKAPAAA